MKTLQMLHVSGIAICMLAAQTLSAGEYNLTVDPVIIDTGNFTRVGVGYNGTSPGPVLRFKEGEDVIINITNNLSEMTSIHWHGLILPYQQDGVPGFSYNGIAPGETFTHRFPIVQSGTYWFHSHSPFQEPDGAYGAIIIEPKQREPFRYDREYVVQLTDAHPHGGKSSGKPSFGSLAPADRPPICSFQHGFCRHRLHVRDMALAWPSPS